MSPADVWYPALYKDGAAMLVVGVSESPRVESNSEILLRGCWREQLRLGRPWSLYGCGSCGSVTASRAGRLKMGGKRA